MTTTDIITAPNHELPLSGMVRPDGPQHTLWNVYNAMELMTETIENMVDGCAGCGAQDLFKECKTAIAYEADRVDFILEQDTNARGHKCDDERIQIGSYIEFAERIEALAKTVIHGMDNDSYTNDMEINTADAYAAACLILDTARQIKVVEATQ